MGETERSTSNCRSGFSRALFGRWQDGQELAAEAAPTRAGVGPSLEVVTHVRPGPGKEVALDVIHTRREQDRHARCIADRSEEHTSELQSLMRTSYAVFCSKQKQKTKQQNI